jgi:hypothetical protein
VLLLTELGAAHQIESSAVVVRSFRQARETSVLDVRAT